MLQARTLTVLIKRPTEEVYGFLVDPANLGRWTTVGPGRAAPEHGPLAWIYSSARGETLVRFTPPNEFFVLDYSVRMGSRTSHVASVRLIRNGNGTVLTHTSVQQPLVSDAAFASEAEWLQSDLLVLKTLLER